LNSVPASTFFRYPPKAFYLQAFVDAVIFSTNNLYQASQAHMSRSIGIDSLVSFDVRRHVSDSRLLFSYVQEGLSKK